MYMYLFIAHNYQELPHLKVVDLSHNKVSDVHDLHLKIGNISKLGLAHNQLTSLEGRVTCISLGSGRSLLLNNNSAIILTFVLPILCYSHVFIGQACKQMSPLAHVYTPMVCFPAGFAKCRSLLYLDLSSNQITEVCWCSYYSTYMYTLTHCT